LAGQVACGRDPGAERKAARRAAVVAAAPVRDQVEKVAAQYLKHHRARVRASTYRETARVFRVEVLPLWKGKRLSEVTRQDVRGLIDRIVKRGAPVSANRCLASVKAFFNWAISVDVITGASPAASVRPPAPEKPREKGSTSFGLRWFAAPVHNVPSAGLNHRPPAPSVRATCALPSPSTIMRRA